MSSTLRFEEEFGLPPSTDTDDESNCEFITQDFSNYSETGSPLAPFDTNRHGRTLDENGALRYVNLSTVPVEGEETMRVQVDLEDSFPTLNEESCYGDMRTSIFASAVQKQKSAFGHLTFFLKKYCTQNNCIFHPPEHLDLVADPDPESPGERSPEWFSHMIGCFFTYLTCDAYNKTNKKKAPARIAYGTATGYASSIKAFYTQRFADKDISISVFGEEQWKRLRSKLGAAFKQETRRTGKALVDPHEASTNTDRQAIAVGCLWANTVQAAEFWHLNNSMLHFSGCGSEVALNKKTHLKVKTINESHVQFKVIEAFLQRQKDGPEQYIPVFPHRDSYHEDYYFSLVYSLVMMENDSEYMFPTFADKARNETDEKSDSKVSSHWSTVFRKLLDLFKEYAGECNPGLSSHHGKKGSNMLMANSATSAGLPQIFRTGWEVRGVHSLFDYVVGTVVMAVKGGKAVAGWTSSQNNQVVGGYTPSLDDITEE